MRVSIRVDRLYVKMRLARGYQVGRGASLSVLLGGMICKVARAYLPTGYLMYTYAQVIVLQKIMF